MDDFLTYLKKFENDAKRLNQKAQRNYAYDEDDNFFEKLLASDGSLNKKCQTHSTTFEDIMSDTEKKVFDDIAAFCANRTNTDDDSWKPGDDPDEYPLTVERSGKVIQVPAKELNLPFIYKEDDEMAIPVNKNNRRRPKPMVDVTISKVPNEMHEDRPAPNWNTDSSAFDTYNQTFETSGYSQSLSGYSIEPVTDWATSCDACEHKTEHTTEQYKQFNYESSLMNTDFIAKVNDINVNVKPDRNHRVDPEVEKAERIAKYNKTHGRKDEKSKKYVALNDENPFSKNSASAVFAHLASFGVIAGIGYAIYLALT